MFFTASLSLFKSTGTGTNLSNSSNSLFKLFKPVAIFSDLSISNLSISDFKLSKSSFLKSFDVSTPVAFFKSAFDN